MTRWPKEKVSQVFERDIAEHVLMVEHDAGVHRSIMCKKRGSSAYWFRVVTWPGALAIEGDMGCFVFRRLTDMFEFFRSGSAHPDRINPSYWSEKLTAVDRSGWEEYSADLFREMAKEELKEFLDDHDHDAVDLQSRFDEEVLSRADDGETLALSSLMGFEVDGHRPFQHAYEISVREYTMQFLWCLHAIVWTIGRYDQATAPALAEAGASC